MNKLFKKRIALVGSGSMGAILTEKIEQSSAFTCVGVVGRHGCIQTLDELSEKPDVIVDFSHPDQLQMIVDYAKNNVELALVMGTTGYTEWQEQQIRELGDTHAVVRSSNFSLGIIVLQRVLSEIAPVLRETYDVEIIEKHHNRKLDSPSGTAKMLLSAIDRDSPSKKVYGRFGEAKRTSGEIGIHSIRGGTIAGDHTILFAGEDEVLELTHRAGSNQVFANGALRAALFAANAKPGCYTMDQVLFG